MTEIIEEIKKVKKTINYYVLGAINRDYDFLCRGWHPECLMMGIDTEGEQIKCTREWWKDALSSPIDDPKYSRESEITKIEVVGNIANAKVKTVLITSQGITIYTDFLNLLKIRGKWMIVNKIFHAEKEES